MTSPVQQHYTMTDFVQRVTQALAHAGLDVGTVSGEQLAPLDQFHVRGLAATVEMARALQPVAGATVLDVGSGLGGPARYLAAAHDCYVTGIDLSQPFTQVAQLLSERTGVADRTTFLQGDALDLPFPDRAFDYAWTQHVAMNIADRPRLYAGVRRVLKPGGRLAIYDVVVGNGEPVIYPVPWAQDSATSFLLTADAMRQALLDTGFTPLSWADTTADALAWFAAPRAVGQAAPNPLSLPAIAGPDFGPSLANFAQNLREGRAHLVQTIVQRD